MSEDTTPLAHGRSAGGGWHLDGPRGASAVVLSVLAVVAMLVIGAVALVHGHPVVAAVSVPMAFAFAMIPFERLRPRVPAGLYAGELGHGLLLPSYPMRTTTIASLTIFGVVAVSLPVLALRADVEGRAGIEVDLASALPFAAGLVFLAAALGGFRGRRRPASGLLLTPSGVTIGARHRPARVAWDDVRAVRTHWTAAGRGPRVSNWLSFVMSAGDGVDEPTLLADRLAVEPEVVLAVCRFYLEHPGSRIELTTTAATDRVARVGRAL